MDLVLLRVYIFSMIVSLMVVCTVHELYRGFLLVVNSRPIKGSCCFLEQETIYIPSLLSTGWFQ